MRLKKKLLILEKNIFRGCQRMRNVIHSKKYQTQIKKIIKINQMKKKKDGKRFVQIIVRKDGRIQYTKIN